MFLASAAFTGIGVLLLWPVMSDADRPCPDGRSCPDSWLCCELGCCAPGTLPPPGRREPERKDHIAHEYPWYAHWPILFLAGTLMGVCVCCVWCLCFRSGARQCSCMFACCVRRPTSEHDSAGSCYPPPHYSRCGSFHQAPPPYSEVTSKPDLYPLVITCGEGENKGGGNYLMVHYFRNYVIRPPRSLSATSTAESLNSSFICNAANEANSIIPPPYSRSSTYEEWRGGGGGGVGGGGGGGVAGAPLLRSLSSLREPAARAPPRSRTAPPAPPTSQPPDNSLRDVVSSPVNTLNSTFDLDLELIDYDLCCDSGCRPRLGPSPPIHRSASNVVEEPNYEHDFDRLRHMYACPCPSNEAAACESPPQPTSPTQTSRDSTLRRPSDDRHHRRIDSLKRNLRKSSLYMPLGSVSDGRGTRMSARSASRSAPATPAAPGALVPGLLALTQRVSASRLGSKSSKLDEENDPLLADHDNTHGDHKF